MHLLLDVCFCYDDVSCARRGDRPTPLPFHYQATPKAYVRYFSAYLCFETAGFAQQVCEGYITAFCI